MTKNLINEIKEKIKVFDDDNFIFEEEAHKYTYEGKELISVTTFLENFITPFDEEYWSKKKADDRGVDQQVVLNEWAVTRDYACDLGTEVHEYIEFFYADDIKVYENEEVNDRIKKFHTIYDSRLNVLEPVVSELRMFDIEWGLAGTFDQLYTYNGNIIMADWKTNKKIKTDKDYCFGWLKYPFNRYKENEFNKYSIQISLYRLMLKRMTGINIDYGFVCHIPEKGDAKIYKLKDFTKELELYFKQSNEKSQTNQKKTENKPTKTTNMW